MFRISFDDVNKKVYVFVDAHALIVIMFKDILGCEIRENGDVKGEIRCSYKKR